jgi:hypothetical protein
MVKSSLMVRTAASLQELGAHVARLDLTAFGQNLTPDQWYDGLLTRIGEQLDLEDELESYWLTHERLGPMQRFSQALTEVVIAKLSGRVIIFIDEIDVVRSLPFSTDEFYAGIREFHNRRAQNAALGRLTFCLLGVATPSDLIQNVSVTPFNIGKRIELDDFTELESSPLISGLGRGRKLGADLLARILRWTGGHPYLTQKLCQAVANDTSVTRIGDVDRICDKLFFLLWEEVRTITSCSFATAS